MRPIEEREAYGIDQTPEAAEPPALDVERLAEAMHDVEDRKLPMSPWNISEAYARLTREEGT